MTTNEQLAAPIEAGPIGTYSGVPMTATVIGKLPDGSPHVVYGEEIAEGRDLTSNEFFQLVKQEAGFIHWPEALSLRIRPLDSFRDSADLLRSDNTIPGRSTLVALCWTTYFRRFNRRYVKGLTLEVAKTTPLALDQVPSDIADSVKVIAAGVKNYIAGNAEIKEEVAC